MSRLLHHYKALISSTRHHTLPPLWQANQPLDQWKNATVILVKRRKRPLRIVELRFACQEKATLKPSSPLHSPPWSFVLFSASPPSHLRVFPALHCPTVMYEYSNCRAKRTQLLPLSPSHEARWSYTILTSIICGGCRDARNNTLALGITIPKRSNSTNCLHMETCRQDKTCIMRLIALSHFSLSVMRTRPKSRLHSRHSRRNNFNKIMYHSNQDSRLKKHSSYSSYNGASHDAADDARHYPSLMRPLFVAPR